MAYRILGTPSTVTIDGDVLTWAANTFDRPNFERFGVGDYVHNVTDNDVSQITAVGGFQSDYSYKITITNGHGWTGTPAATPQGSNDKLTYTTLTAAWGACSSGDIVLIWPIAGDNRFRSATVIGTTTTVASLIGMCPGLSFSNRSLQWLNIAGDLSANTAELSNFIVHGQRNGACYDISFGDTGGTLEASFICDRLILDGGSQGIVLGDCVAATVRNCLIKGKEYGILLNTTSGTLLIADTTVYRCYYGLQLSDKIVTLTGVACLDSTSYFLGTANASGSHNVSGDTSAPGTDALTGKKYSSIQLAMTNSNDLRPDWFDITVDSDLYHTGTPVAGVTYDLVGRVRHVTTPSRGCLEGPWAIGSSGGGMIVHPGMNGGCNG